MKYSFEYVKNLAKDLNFEILNDLEYKGVTSHLKIKCLKCNKIDIKEARTIIQKTCSCQYCSGHRSKKYTTEEIKNKIYQAVKDEYELLGDYEHHGIKIPMLHKKCNKVWKVNMSDFLNRNVRCPFCAKSIGEIEVEKILKDKNIKFETQFSFKDLKYKKPLRFDFYLPEYKSVIEVDGIWHAVPYKYQTDEISFNNLMERHYKDELKNQFCLDNNIPILRIPTYSFNKLKPSNLIFMKTLIDRFLDSLKIDHETDKKMMEYAKEISKESHCFKTQVGSIIAYEDKILSTGANQVCLDGSKNCKDLGYCYKRKLGIEHGDSYCKVLHSEEKALINAMNNQIPVYKATIYCTHKPCLHCTKMIINSGIQRIVYLEDYPSGELAKILLKEANIICEQFKY